MAIVPPFVHGQLLDAWWDNVLVREDIYTFKGIDSSLLGTHKVYVFSKDDGSIHCVSQDLESYTESRQQCRKYQHSQSRWSLGQVLVDLGVLLPPQHSNIAGEIIDQYDCFYARSNPQQSKLGPLS